MLKYLPKENMGSSNLGWLQSRFHFSFAEYRNPKNINFGALRVLNDDFIQPESGFEMHPHHDIEIITYIVDGEITHKDSMGNEETLYPGEVQYMSAGEGIRHSEYNNHKNKVLHSLQIWIIPPQKSLPRLYGSYRYKKEDRHNKVLNIVSSMNGEAKVKIHQDINMYVNELDANQSFSFSLKEGRQIYFVQIEGECTLNGHNLNHGDAMEITKEEALHVCAKSKAHVLFIEMKEE